MTKVDADLSAVGTRFVWNAVDDCTGRPVIRAGTVTALDAAIDGSWVLTVVPDDHTQRILVTGLQAAQHVQTCLAGCAHRALPDGRRGTARPGPGDRLRPSTMVA